MRFEFEHLGTTTPFELSEGLHLLGGGPEDHIRLEGLPPRLLSLRIECQRLMVEAALTFTVNGVLAPPGVPRLVLPGEVLGLPEEMCLRVLQQTEGERGVGTVAVLKGLLTGAEELAPSRAATLTCLTGLDVGRTHALAEQCTPIGRGREVTLRLRDRAVSRTHARILHGEDGFTLEDLDSPNGVFVNGQRVRGRAPLVDGDVIELGRSLLRFQAPLAEPPPPEEGTAGSEVAPADPAARDAVQEPGAPMPATDAPTPASPSGARRPRGEWWLIGVGAVAAIIGLAVTYALAGTG
ncbi:FHA domain-containing protein [Pyxidicoccus fallax]|uniref:FHA domain-containing protein n=1 Tax=Pyxidicoccus fallax TaxID=394095 RepID=A0A848LY18_9BACT|nr:FHA domain-containing protein [Pyxidicoccus fallax]NMO22422.1 FHA domain-containing protein [Pyxidicoccus fallax]NPC84319.1 FHA domain-containing protein [Pyxidicoccus fallax]